MIKIKKENVRDAELIFMENGLWGSMYTPISFAQLSYDDEGFNIELTSFEDDPKRTKTEHFDPVHLDSCLEFFCNFDPENSDKYINFEANANGVMNAAFRSDRHNSQKLLKEEIEAFGISAELYYKMWSVSYKISFSFIKKYYPQFDIKKCEYIKCNFYKCGDETFMPHYLSHFDVGCEKPDFHRPEYFGKIYIEK